MISKFDLGCEIFQKKNFENFESEKIRRKMSQFEENILRLIKGNNLSLLVDMSKVRFLTFFSTEHMIFEKIKLRGSFNLDD